MVQAWGKRADIRCSTYMVVGIGLMCAWSHAYGTLLMLLLLLHVHACGMRHAACGMRHAACGEHDHLSMHDSEEDINLLLPQPSGEGSAGASD